MADNKTLDDAIRAGIRSLGPKMINVDVETFILFKREAIKAKVPLNRFMQAVIRYWIAATEQEASKKNPATPSA